MHLSRTLTRRRIMPNYVIHRSKEEELYHFGIPGMKWGVRRVKNNNNNNNIKLSKEKISAIAGTASVVIGASVVAKILQSKKESANNFLKKSVVETFNENRDAIKNSSRANKKVYKKLEKKAKKVIKILKHL